MSDGDTPDDDDQDPGDVVSAVDRWEDLLVQIAADVGRIRGIVVMAWYFSWFALLVLVVTTDIWR